MRAGAAAGGGLVCPAGHCEVGVLEEGGDDGGELGDGSLVGQGGGQVVTDTGAGTGAAGGGLGGATVQFGLAVDVSSLQDVFQGGLVEQEQGLWIQGSQAQVRHEASDAGEGQVDSEWEVGSSTRQDGGIVAGGGLGMAAERGAVGDGESGGQFGPEAIHAGSGQVPQAGGLLCLREGRHEANEHLDVSQRVESGGDHREWEVHGEGQVSGDAGGQAQEVSDWGQEGEGSGTRARAAKSAVPEMLLVECGQAELE